MAETLAKVRRNQLLVARVTHPEPDAGTRGNLLEVGVGTSWLVEFPPEGETVVLSAQDRNASIRVNLAEPAFSKAWRGKSGLRTEVEERSVWEAAIHVPNGIQHAYAVSDSPEAAVEAAMGRAVAKYGRQDWTRWKFRAELCCTVPVTLREVHFAWTDGALRRL